MAKLLKRLSFCAQTKVYLFYQPTQPQKETQKRLTKKRTPKRAPQWRTTKVRKQQQTPTS
jgi:hypothetical protein